MIELTQLEHLITFADAGTLSKAAENLHISQPTLTRSMQKLENEFDVPLFNRTKNKMILNDNGILAVDYARKILGQTNDMLNLVRMADRKKHTISIGSCAPMPMLSLVQKAAQAYSDMTITSELRENDFLLRGLKEGTYQIIILPYEPKEAGLYCNEYEKENLLFALPLNHRFAHSTGLYMKDLDGENMLLLSDIGFWHDLPKQKMPNSRFLEQSDRFDFDELIQSSVLPCFASDSAVRIAEPPKNRVLVPILDKEASVTYYIICLKNKKSQFKKII
ncbi:MAG: LysR family transcriptional regulator [Clostridiales bacterium]|nr:LysR family transcriptional regulator [Clostridiales bacterium]